MAELPPEMVQKHSPTRLAALKSGKTIFDGELLATLQRIADSADRLVAYYERVFNDPAPASAAGRARKGDKTDA